MLDEAGSFSFRPQHGTSRTVELEATSALDAEAEGAVQALHKGFCNAVIAGSSSLREDALDTVMAGRTTLVIAHRLSARRKLQDVQSAEVFQSLQPGTIRNAHSIVCMRDGQIVERGSPKAH